MKIPTRTLTGEMAGAVVAILSTHAASFAYAAPKSKGFAEPPAEITVPDRVETRLGTLEYKDGAPTAATIAKVYDDLMYVRAVDVFMKSFSGASTESSSRKSTTSPGA